MAMNQLGFSARAFHRVLKEARTVADLAGSEVIQAAHLAEALHYRPRQLRSLAFSRCPLTVGRYLPIITSMRRKPGVLLPLELSILEVGLDLRRRGAPEYHGFLIAKEIQAREDTRLLTAYGTLYKALARMERVGLLISRWEDPLVAANENRPRRRLYQVTVAGQNALREARPFPAGFKVKLEPKKATR